jgi:hypothetical protein
MRPHGSGSVFRAGIAGSVERQADGLDHRRPPGDLFGERSPHPIVGPALIGSSF